MPLSRPLPSSPARVLLAAAALGLALAVPGAVRAHAELVASSPAANATLASAPASVSLTFTEPVDPANAGIVLVDAERRAVDGVGTAVVAADGLIVEAALPDLAPGTYTVSYQVVSTHDGHATAGSFAFLVDPSGTAAPPTDTAASSSPSVAPAAIAARWLALLGVLVSAGSLVAWWHSGRPVLTRLAPGATTGPPWILVAIGAAAALTGLVLYLVVAARPILDAGGGGIGLDPVAPYGWTPFAIAMRVALAGSLAAAVLASLRVARAGSRRSDGTAVAVAAALLGVALAGMSVAGHAAALGGPVAAAIDWLHMAAVAAWLGGLPALVLLARHAVRSGTSSPAAWGAILRRHGRLALVTAPLVIMTGIANSTLMVGSGRDLVASDYGNLLVAKAILVSVALGIGAVNHLALRGRGRGATGVLVTTELAVAVLAVAAAGAMVTIQPSATRQPVLVEAPLTPAHLFANVGPASVHGAVTYPTPSHQTYLVSVADLDTGGPLRDVQAVFMTLTPPPESGLPPGERIELQPTHDPGFYRASGAYTPVEGTWELELVIRRRGLPDAPVSFELAVANPPPAERAPPEDTGLQVPGPIAALWPLIPPGALAWLTLLVLLAVTWGVGRGTRGRGRVSALAVLAIGFAVVLAAAGSRDLVALANVAPEAAREAPAALDDASVERGEDLYLANCASCHGRSGEGDGPVRSLPAAGPMAEAVQRMTPGEVEYRIANGMAGTPMPSFVGTLSESDRWDLVAYLRQRFGE